MREQQRSHDVRSGIRSEKVFSVILDRERSRADRNGHELSLVLFEAAEDGKTAALLVRAMKTRARSIDRFGWFDERSIGVILPNTPYAGGCMFARDIGELVAARNGGQVSCRVYTYPGRWMPKKSHFIREKHHPAGGRYLREIDPMFSRGTPFWKRSIDVSGAVLGLLLTAPFFLFVPLLVKLVSPGPGFYTQERVGRGGRLFNFLKFRTMHLENDAASHQAYLSRLIKSERPMTKLDDARDRRIIPLGRIIRKACIDELPQLINVLRGDMSLVGPRPCLPYEAREYLKWHTYRFDIKPGITGLWQVSGKNRLSFREMISLDILYGKRLSPWLDLRIIARTFPSVLAMMVERPRTERHETTAAAPPEAAAVGEPGPDGGQDLSQQKLEVYS